MKSYYKKECSTDLYCDENLLCGSYLTLQEDMNNFFANNIGILNSGWIETGETPTGYEYLYVNVEKD